jgi:hypothetical protein
VAGEHGRNDHRARRLAGYPANGCTALLRRGPKDRLDRWRTLGHDVMPPATSLGRAQSSQAMRKPTFSFNSGEPGSTFSCQLDKLKLRRCTSPKNYKRLAPGRHVFRVKARDRAGNLDTTPAVKRIRIKKR